MRGASRLSTAELFTSDDLFPLSSEVPLYLVLNVLLKLPLPARLSDSPPASVPSAEHRPEHQDSASVWLPQRGQVQLHQQGQQRPLLSVGRLV